jgi:hypothetical protein
MATYYIRKTGSDSNAGTSAGAAWLTIGKALGASGMASGDTVYVGAGVYRESVTVAMTSPGTETMVCGDVDGKYTGDPGEIRWTAYTTDDKTSPTTKTLILAGRPHLTFKNMVFVGGTTACVDGYSSTGAVNEKFQDCTFFSGTGAANDDSLLRWTNATGEAANWTIDRCVFVMTYGAAIMLDTLTPAASADYSVAMTISNCLFVGGSVGGASPHAVIYCTGGGSGSGSGKPGGPAVQNCTNLVGGTPLISTDSNFSTSSPSYVKNCLSIGGGLSAASTGQIIEDYNVLIAPTNRTNVSTGTNSKAGTTYSPLIHVGQNFQQKRLPKPFATPTFDSPLLGFGNDTSNPTDLSVDFLNRMKPSGSGVTWDNNSKAVGYLELHDYGVKETSTVDSGSTTSLNQDGVGDIELRVPVDASATIITIKVFRDSNYGGGTLPQVTLVANGELGVSTQTVADTGSASTWNTITLSSFTPTGRGWVNMRLVSNATTTGKCYWDTVSVT